MRSWKRQFAALCIGQFLSIFAFNLVWPFFSLYIQEMEGATATEAAVWASLLAASSSLTMALFQPIWGVLADRLGRKLMVQRSMLSAAAILTLMGLAQNVYQLWLLRIAQGAFTGTVAANTALAAGIVPKARLGFALGLIHSAVYLSNGVSPLVGGFLAGATNFRFPFFLTGFFMLAGTALITFGVSEPARSTFEPAAREKRGSIRWVFGVPAILVTATAHFVVYFGNMAAYPILPLVTQELTPDPAQVPQMVGLLVAMSSITGALASASAGRLGDRLGHRNMLVIATLGSGLLYLPQAFATSLEQLFVLRIVLGIFLGGAIPSANAIVARAAPANRQGSAFGVTSMAQSLGAFAGPLLGAVVSSQLGIRGVFVMTGIVLLLVTVWIAVMLGRAKTPPSAADAAAD